MASIKKAQRVAVLQEKKLIPAKAVVGRFTMVNVNGPEMMKIKPERDDPPDTAFMDTVRQFGVVIPILLVKANLGDKTFSRLVAGNERVWAARIVSADPEYASAAQVPALWWYEYEVISPDLLTLLENRARSDNMLTDVKCVRRLMRQGFTQEDICLLAKIHPATFKAYAKYDKLLPEFEEAWLIYGTIDIGVVNQLVRLSEAEQRRLLARYQQNGSYLTQAMVKEILDERKPAANEPPASLPAPLVVESPVKQAEDWRVTVCSLLGFAIAAAPADHPVRGQLEAIVASLTPIIA